MQDAVLASSDSHLAGADAASPKFEVLCVDEEDGDAFPVMFEGTGSAQAPGLTPPHSPTLHRQVDVFFHTI